MVSPGEQNANSLIKQAEATSKPAANPPCATPCQPDVPKQMPQVQVQAQFPAVLRREITPQNGLHMPAGMTAPTVSPGYVTYAAPPGYTGAYRIEAPAVPAVAQCQVAAPSLAPSATKHHFPQAAYTVATHPAPAWATGRPA